MKVASVATYPVAAAPAAGAMHWVAHLILIRRGALSDPLLFQSLATG